MIKHEGNLSVPDLDRVIYSIFKYLQKESVGLLINLPKMLLHTRRCIFSWKEREILILSKPVQSEEEKSETSK
jgi:hypothetical protein